MKKMFAGFVLLLSTVVVCHSEANHYLHKAIHAELMTPIGNAVTGLEASFVVPDQIPEPVNGSLKNNMAVFIWPGIQPYWKTANRTVGRGIMQPVLSMTTSGGESPAPFQPRNPYGKWWISNQYYNPYFKGKLPQVVGNDSVVNKKLTGGVAVGSVGGKALLVNPGDHLSTSMRYNANSKLWEFTLKNNTRPGEDYSKYDFKVGVEEQKQTRAAVAVEMYIVKPPKSTKPINMITGRPKSIAELNKGVKFTDIKIELEKADPYFCKPLGDTYSHNRATEKDPSYAFGNSKLVKCFNYRSGDGGKTCHIDSCTIIPLANAEHCVDLDGNEISCDPYF